MRRIVAIVGGALVATVFTSGPAWAGDDKSEKKGVKVRQHEENVLEADGLPPELVERAVEALRAHHPGVQVKGKGGMLRISSSDGHAFKAALGALKELGLPMDVHAGEHERQGGDGERAKDGPPRAKKPKGDLPSDQDFEKKIHMLEEKIVAAREAGREGDVKELEQALDKVRQMRKEARARREHGVDAQPKHKEGREAAQQELRKHIDALEHKLGAARADGKERAVAELEQALEQTRAKLRALKSGEQGPDLAELRDRMERAKREMVDDMEQPRGPRPGPGRRLPEARGERREGGGPPGELRARMQHVRQAMEHLRAAGLGEHAQRLEIALHRMELAAQGQGGPGGMGPQGKGPEGMGLRRMGPGGVGPGGMGPGGMGPGSMGPGGPGPNQAGPRRGGPGAPQTPRAPMPPPAAREPAPQLGTLPQGPPPSVGGVRRGPIHVRPRVIAPQPPRGAGAPAPISRQGSPVPLEGKSFHLGEEGAARLFRPEGAQEALIVVEGAGGAQPIKRVVKLERTGADGVFVLEGKDGREVRIELGEPRAKSVAPGAVRPPPVPVVKAPRPQPTQGDAQRQVEELRAQVEQLRQKLERLLREMHSPK